MMRTRRQNEQQQKKSASSLYNIQSSTSLHMNKKPNQLLTVSRLKLARNFIYILLCSLRALHAAQHTLELTCGLVWVAKLLLLLLLVPAGSNCTKLAAVVVIVVLFGAILTHELCALPAHDCEPFIYFRLESARQKVAHISAHSCVCVCVCALTGGLHTKAHCPCVCECSLFLYPLILSTIAACATRVCKSSKSHCLQHAYISSLACFKVAHPK